MLRQRSAICKFQESHYVGNIENQQFLYDLPEELIAQTPVEPRDSSRLLVYHRENKSIEHRIFRDITDYLKAGDVLVLNRTRVLPPASMPAPSTAAPPRCCF